MHPIVFVHRKSSSDRYRVFFFRASLVFFWLYLTVFKPITHIFNRFVISRTCHRTLRIIFIHYRPFSALQTWFLSINTFFDLFGQLGCVFERFQLYSNITTCYRLSDLFSGHHNTFIRNNSSFRVFYYYLAFGY